MNRTPVTLFAQVTESDTQNLYDIAISKGILMPHPALGIFKSVLAEIEKPNGNGVRLGKKATDNAVATLIGTQVNQNHSVRRDRETGEFIKTPIILGHTIDAKINNKNQIEIVCLFYKHQYYDAWEEAQELFDKNQLTMSFELSHDIESADKLSDGTIRLNDYYFTGSGLLFGIKPACKKAHVELMATKLEEKLLRERQCLIFANNQSSQNSIMEVLKQMAEEAKKVDEVQTTEPIVAEQTQTVDKIVEPKVEEAKKVCPTCNEPMTDDECAVCKSKKTEEAKVEAPITEEPKVEAAVVPPTDQTVVVTETTQKITDIMVPGSETVKTEVTEVRTVNDKEQVKTVTTQEVTYTYAQVEEIKASYEKQIKELKDENESLKTQSASKDAEIIAMKATVEKLSVKEEVATEKIKLSTGHNMVEAAEAQASEENNVTPLAKVLRNKKR